MHVSETLVIVIINFYIRRVFEHRLLGDMYIVLVSLEWIFAKLHNRANCNRAIQITLKETQQVRSTIKVNIVQTDIPGKSARLTVLTAD